MPKQKYGDQISQREAKSIRFHLEHNLHVSIPSNWSAWNKIPAKVSEEVAWFSNGEITLGADEIELLLGRAVPA